MAGKTSIEEMVRFVRQEFNPESDAGLKKYIEFQPIYSGCACMGPKDGWSVCYCVMMDFVYQNKLKILAEINESEAREYMRKQLIKALGG